MRSTRTTFSAGGGYGRMRSRSRVLSSSLSAAVAALFAAGMKGAWYERSDLTTLYQDGGNTPVSAPAQPVGLVLSKDQRLARSAELVANGDFSDGANNWTMSANWTVSGGQLVATGAAANTSAQTSASVLTAGKWYEIKATCKSLTAGGWKLLLEGGANVFGDINTTGSFVGIIQATTTGSAYVWANSLLTAAFDDISVRELPGNHALQATQASKPLYQVTPKRVVFDGVDDSLTTAFAVALGATCTVGRAIPGTGAVITTGVNIGTSYADSTTACAMVIVDGALNAAQTTALTAYLNQQALL